MQKSREVLRRGLPVIINDCDAPDTCLVAILMDENPDTGTWRARYLSTNISMTFCAATPGPHFCITPLADFGKKIHWITDLHYRVSSTGLDNIATYPDGVARPWAGHPDTHAHAKAPAAELFRKLEPLVTPELSEKLKMVDGFDQKILREISGDEQEDLKWGAAMGISVEKLRRMGLVAGFGKVAITDLGRRALIHLT